jgi:hypothetical protein
VRHSIVSGLGLMTLAAACSAGGGPGVGPHDDGGSAGASGKGSGATGGVSGSSGKGGGVNVGGSSATGNGGGGSSGDAGTSGTSGTAGDDTGVPSINCQPTDANAGSPLLRLLTSREFDSTINAIFPQIAGQWSNTLPANSLSVYGFDNDGSAVVGKQYASALLDTALAVATAVTGPSLQNLLPCAAAAKDHACAQTFVEGFGKRLFRRPVAAAESQRYLALFDSGLALSDFPTALKWVTAGMIQSPYAVYRSELGTVTGGVRKLTAHEVATELSYTFKGLPPDDALLAKADSAGDGPLPDPVSEATAMLETPEGQGMVQQFFTAYLGTTGLTSKTKANLANGDANYASVSADMANETVNFLKNVVMQKPGTLRDLLTEPSTYPSPALARFYASEPSSPTKFPIPASDGAAVTRPAGQGIGILAQGSFLAAHANTDASSPTQRGLFVYSRLLCRPKLSPPNAVPPLANSATAKTTRERYELVHAASGTCKSCHSNFDPIGYGFEAFDEGGRFRTSQNDVTIDPSGNIPSLDDAPGVTFMDQEGLAQALADQPEAGECFAAYLATFAYGSAEACLGTSNAAALHDGTATIMEAFAGLAAEKHFTERNPQ